MDQLVFNDVEHGYKIAKTAGSSYDRRTCTVISRVRDDELMGGVLYTNFTGESIMAHIASFNDHWINRDLIYVAFDYPFNQLGVKRIFGLVREDANDVLQFDTKLGFSEVARIEGMFRGNVAGIVLRMDRDACRLMGVKPRNIQIINRH